MRQRKTKWRSLGILAASAGVALVPAMALAAPHAKASAAPESILPESILPEAVATPAPAQTPAGAQSSGAQPAGVQPTGTEVAGVEPAVPELPLAEPVMEWPMADAQALLAAIEGIGAEGLIPEDYQPVALRAALAAGEGEALDKVASQSFAWLVEDLRDGRTPVEARVQWFALDPDRDTMPTAALMTMALASHDIAGILAGLAPTHPDYVALKEEFQQTPESDKPRRDLIRANMDRWRWLARDMGKIYLYTNVPEFQARLIVKNRTIRSYRTIVGKPGHTATPQLAETVQAVVFNPTWTVPQSIVQGEGLGAKLLVSPSSAARQGYKVAKAADGTISVVQQPGPRNALGLMKIDMPNPHAIYMHDTPSKALFSTELRAYSHGCIRTERAVELGMTMAILGAGMAPEEAARISNSGKYTRVTMNTTFPVYIAYFTMARDIAGNLSQFADIYGRDAPVIESFGKARLSKTTQRVSDEPVIQLDNPL